MNSSAMKRGRRAIPMEVKLATNSRIDHQTLCQVWTASLSHNGYGIVGSGVRLPRKLRAHRASYEYAFGPIPDGMHIDHLCRNRSCINPDHLEVVDPGENTRRGNSPSMISSRNGRCFAGHEFTPETTYVDPKGRRNCKICRREKARFYYQRSKTPDLPTPQPEQLHGEEL